jgi:hypothetical protein
MDPRLRGDERREWAAAAAPLPLPPADRIHLDPGTTYTVSQVGADVVIDLGAGSKTVLAGVTLATLPSGWIFGA